MGTQHAGLLCPVTLFTPLQGLTGSAAPELLCMRHKASNNPFCTPRPCAAGKPALQLGTRQLSHKAGAY